MVTSIAQSYITDSRKGTNFGYLFIWILIDPLSAAESHKGIVHPQKYHVVPNPYFIHLRNTFFFANSLKSHATETFMHKIIQLIHMN